MNETILNVNNRLKIVSDGNSKRTRIYDGDGNDISRYFSAVEWRCDVTSAIAEARLVARNVAVEVEGMAMIDETALGDSCRSLRLAHMPESEG